MTENLDTAPTTSATAHSRTEIVLPGKVEPDGLQVRTTVPPAPTPGRALVRMECTGVAFAEQQMRRGKYYKQPPFPFVPGYDLVGVVDQVGAGVDPTWIGRRVAAITKVGAWSTLVDVAALDLLPVPDDLDAAAVETVIVNGITAWQMLHERARVERGGTVVVLGANGGVGSTLVQLAHHAGIRVIGTAATRHHELVRTLGAEPVDARDPQHYEHIRRLAPGGVDAVFDHVGGPGIRESWSLLRRGGSLVAYGTASTMSQEGNSQLPILRLFARLTSWNSIPNGRRAEFYDLWSGKSRRPERYQQQQAHAFANVLELLRSGALVPQIAGRFPLDRAADALTLAESRTVAGKVILQPR
ncbi:medium chain dehydrogenase/reductase family protein [Rhodococcus sp. G-MC3]|uniref:medium chain dehydrogenase/reductase family protein n=1 Tax=Rhodococcus sp. G-MC3 TaxID=3046209 RepID=UPI0024BB004F|nr:medium chain dehydrogenase/reductase family protein [Rhodococcus sp. G-MC3]MDJ0392439.1 medium chain dehydrogenase/reductase family protein [Rhodococcus sp. G-MC3]